MDTASSVLAALQAGKLPSQKQLNSFIDFLCNTVIPQIKPTDDYGLTEHGILLADALRQLLLSYAQFGTAKNQDDIVQQIICHLSHADISDASTDIIDVDVDSAKEDLRTIRSSLSTILTIVWQSISSSGVPLFEDFTSFARLALADAAESLEGTAASAKTSLREVEDEVQKGDRDTLGRQKTDEPDNAQASFERGMDTAKDIGSSAIGTTEKAVAKVQDAGQRISSRLRGTWTQICDRSQKDPEYRNAVNTVLSILHKWFNKSLETVPEDAPALSSLVDDPTPEQHITKSLNLFATLAERLTNTSLTPLLDQLRKCALDVRSDPDLKAWFNEFIQYSRKSLNEPGYVDSQDAKDKRSNLKKRWTALRKGETANSQQWNKDVQLLKEEADRIAECIDEDKDLQRIKTAHQKFGDVVNDTSNEVQQELNWVWQDLFKVYLPRALDTVKDVPIPRIEYKDEGIEFVLENLDISSFSLLPSQVFIRNITDVSISASADPSQSTSAIGTLTHIRVQALQLQLKDLSFYYKDKETTLGPETVTGLLSLTLPPKGIDVDLQFRLIPTNAKEKREALHKFHIIEKLDVKIHEEAEISIKESNHGILLTMFKPVFTMRVREAVEAALAEQMRTSLDWLDGLLWDVSERKEVVKDMGVSDGAAWAGAIWSEIGKLRRMSDANSGIRTTGTGLVLSEETSKTQVAIGAEPQILSGDKRGPVGTGSKPIGEVLSEAADKAGVEGADAGDAAKEVAETADEAVRQTKQVVGSFKKSVETKRKREEAEPGWRSSAFDM